MGLKGVARFLDENRKFGAVSTSPESRSGFSVLLWHSPFMLTGDGSFTMRPYLWE